MDGGCRQTWKGDLFLLCCKERHTMKKFLGGFLFPRPAIFVRATRGPTIMSGRGGSPGHDTPGVGGEQQEASGLSPPAHLCHCMAPKWSLVWHRGAAEWSGSLGREIAKGEDCLLLCRWGAHWLGPQLVRAFPMHFNCPHVDAFQFWPAGSFVIPVWSFSNVERVANGSHFGCHFYSNFYAHTLDLKDGNGWNY